jgi:dCTP deaminase
MKGSQTICAFCGASLNLARPECGECGLSQGGRTLVDWEIRILLERGILVIDPILSLEDQIGTVGIDLRLDVYFREFLYMRQGFIDLADEIPARQFYFLREIDIEREEAYFVQPGSFVLAQSLEYIALPKNIYGRLGGRSSLAKSGIEVHATSEKVDPGFRGHLTFELKNCGRMPVKLYPLQRVATFMLELTSDVEKPYGGIFQHQVQIRPPKPDPDLLRLRAHLKRKG